MESILLYVKNHSGELALFATVIPITISFVVMAFTSYQYVVNRKNELRQQEFENFHNLINWLVNGRDGKAFVDNQIACVYEITKYKKYKTVSKRILIGLKQSWQGKVNSDRIITEIDIALKQLK